MTRTLSVAIVFALFFAAAARAQSTTPAPPSTQQPAKPAASLEDDPTFKRLPPDEQAWVKQILERAHKAMENQDFAALDQIKQDINEHQAAALASAPASPKTGAPATPQAPNAQNPQAGCTAGPVKKPGFHIPKAMQDAINKQTKQIGKQTGVDVDPNAPAQAVKDAQKNIPCPPSPVPATKPANQ